MNLNQQIFACITLCYATLTYVNASQDEHQESQKLPAATIEYTAPAPIEGDRLIPGVISTQKYRNIHSISFSFSASGRFVDTCTGTFEYPIDLYLSQIPSSATASPEEHERIQGKEFECNRGWYNQHTSRKLWSNQRKSIKTTTRPGNIAAFDLTLHVTDKNNIEHRINYTSPHHFVSGAINDPEHIRSCLHYKHAYDTNGDEERGCSELVLLGFLNTFLPREITSLHERGCHLDKVLLKIYSERNLCENCSRVVPEWGNMFFNTYHTPIQILAKTQLTYCMPSSPCTPDCPTHRAGKISSKGKKNKAFDDIIDTDKRLAPKTPEEERRAARLRRQARAEDIVMHLATADQADENQYPLMCHPITSPFAQTMASAGGSVGDVRSSASFEMHGFDHETPAKSFTPRSLFTSEATSDDTPLKSNEMSDNDMIDNVTRAYAGRQRSQQSFEETSLKTAAVQPLAPRSALKKTPKPQKKTSFETSVPAPFTPILHQSAHIETPDTRIETPAARIDPIIDLIHNGENAHPNTPPHTPQKAGKFQRMGVTQAEVNQIGYIYQMQGGDQTARVLFG